MDEIEIAILERNALSRRLQDKAALCRQVVAVETERNAHRRCICWQFTSLLLKPLVNSISRFHHALLLAGNTLKWGSIDRVYQ
jgi:hypothetical protein